MSAFERKLKQHLVSYYMSGGNAPKNIRYSRPMYIYWNYCHLDICISFHVIIIIIIIINIFV